MSTTAGLGSQDYVAINPLAVVAVLLGIASFLALFGTILLVVPVVAVIVAIVALSQIRNSNGTQSGTMLAWLGLVLGIGFAALVGGSAVVQRMATRADEQQIVALIEQFGQHIHEQRYDDAYALFTDRFQERIRRQRFVDLWTGMNNIQGFGRVAAIKWNGRLHHEVDHASDTRYGLGMIVISFEKSQMTDRQEARFRKTPGGEWRFDDIPQYFPAEQPPQQQPQPR
jgi:hypothetical protein